MNLKSTLILLSLTGAAFVASRLIGSQDHESARTESYMNNEDPSPNWSGAGNTSTSNDSYASNSRLSVPIFGVGPLVSDALDITQFGFNIPTSATILGITATIERSANRRDASNNVTDNKITLIRFHFDISQPNNVAHNIDTNPIAIKKP